MEKWPKSQIIVLLGGLKNAQKKDIKTAKNLFIKYVE